MFAETFPSGWTAVSYASSYITTYEAGYLGAASRQEILDDTWHKYDRDLIRKTITNMFNNGNYVIAGVNQYDDGTQTLAPFDVPEDNQRTIAQHWVVIAGLSGNNIAVMNPMTNSYQWYTWDIFLDSFRYELLEIIPPGCDATCQYMVNAGL